MDPYTVTALLAETTILWEPTLEAEALAAKKLALKDKGTENYRSSPVNVDAAFDVKNGRGATGACIRNDRGNFIAASGHPIGAVDAAMAEAQACVNGIHLANQVGCQKLKIQSDCIQVLSTLKNVGFTASANEDI